MHPMIWFNIKPVICATFDIKLFYTMKLVRLLLLFLVTPLITHAQNKVQSNIDSLANDFLKYLGSFDKEKILLQTDRHIYASGEPIYFKAYLIDSITSQLRSTPKKLYVDLVNSNDSVFGQLLLNASTLKTSGEFMLNDSLAGGYYWIRAYNERTASENLGAMTVAPVYIVNPYRRHAGNEEPVKKENMDSATTPVVQVFPEGGNIISGINTTVAVKVTNELGYPVVTQGILKDNADDVYAKFITNSDGLAKFSFNPIWYHRYYIYLLNKNKYDSVAALPPINSFAGQLAVTEQNDNQVKVRIVLEDSIDSKDYKTYLLAISGDSICYSAVGQGMYELLIPLKNFSHGICRLLLFNANKRLLSERDIFIKKENYNISINTDKENYGAREDVKIDISVTDKNNKPLLATLACAVTDIRVTDTTMDNCMKDTLQSFSTEDADLIMLTKKNEYANWRMADTLNGLKTINDSEKMPGEISSEEKDNNSSFTISGTVLNKKGEPAAKKLVTIFFNKNYTWLNTDTTDVTGRFKFFLPDYNDSTKFIVQVSNLKGKKEDEYKILYDTVYMPRFSTPVYMKKKFEFDEKLQSIINELYNSDSVYIGSGKEWLRNVTVKARKRYKKPEVDYDETKRVSPFSHIITSEMFDRGAGRAGNALLMVPGVHSTGNSISIGGPVNFFGQMSPPLVVLNGVAMDTTALGTNVMDFINSLPPSTIDFIEVITGSEGAMYGMQGGNGVILINTKNAPRRNERNLKGLPSFYPRGFNSAQPFVMPDYNNKATKASKVPDLRTTIFWNGNIITNLNGKVSLNFFTADKPTTYLVTVTGVTANGDKIYKSVTLSRK